MSLPKVVPGRPQAQPLALDEVFAQIRNKGFNALGEPTGFLLEDDGTIRQQLVLFDDVLATQVRWNAEADGEARVSLVGLDNTSTIQNWLVEPTGEGHIVLNGYDTSGSPITLRVNPRDELQIDSHGMPVHIDPTDLTTALDTTVHTVPAGAVDTVEVEVVLHTDPNTDITVYVVESGGATGTDTQRWSGRLRDQDEPIRLGPWHLEESGTIQVLAGTANRASVQPIIWRKTL